MNEMETKKILKWNQKKKKHKTTIKTIYDKLKSNNFEN